MTFNKKTLSIIVLFLLFIALISPWFVNFYINGLLLKTNIRATHEDLWNYSATVFTTMLAGAFILFQIWYQEKKEEEAIDEQNRPELELSFGHADISNESSYLYCEDFYINSLKQESKFNNVKKVFFSSMNIPYTFRIQNLFNTASKVKIHYVYTSNRGNKYLQEINAGYLSVGQSMDFITTSMLKKINNDSKFIDAEEVPSNSTDYFPSNIVGNKIYVHFQSVTKEKCVTVWTFKKVSHKSLERIEGSCEIAFEKDRESNRYKEILNEFHEYSKGKKTMKSHLVKLNERLSKHDCEEII
ncbi:hypothetical protein [Macrococcus armenti]|uniref:hypothetical protein n=1 Tax=Macrococcus armenti TaxID=2875764 RepID=UPI001CCDBB48|nr:hypothetical protein [Macrococcus armenti]UBH15796.1 hypothetical protein LAU44_02275 [Macrococcus armenti]UBH18155.1 hypothetical protein LAU39_02280 [Macrococcus armenti]UBH20422.1 hypothetical protein LAU40_02275 [Macrococcus armenti]